MTHSEGTTSEAQPRNEMARHTLDPPEKIFDSLQKFQGGSPDHAVLSLLRGDDFPGHLSLDAPVACDNILEGKSPKLFSSGRRLEG